MNDLFDACFRIQREASEAAGRYIPMVIENVKGAQRWSGTATLHYGSFYLWGDVPALMPFTRGGRKGAAPVGTDAPKGTGGSSWFFGTRADPRDMRRNEDGEYTRFGQKNEGGSWFGVAHNTTSGHSRNPVNDGVKGPGGDWFANGRQGQDACADGIKVGGRSVLGGSARVSRSSARKAASAAIAEIPHDLARWIAACYYPKH